MTNKIFSRILSFILSIMLVLSLCTAFTACKGEDGGSDSDKNDDTPKGVLDYKVNLVNYADEAVSDVVVHVLKNGEQVKMNVAGPTGSVKFSLDAGDYTVSLESVDSDKTFSYDESSCVLSAEAPEITVVLYNGLEESGSITFNIDDTEVEYKTYRASVGGSFTRVPAKSASYFIFTPTRQGHYKISSSDPSVKVEYRGAPTFPLPYNVADMESDGSFYLNVKDSNIGTNGTGTSQYIIGMMNESDGDISSVLKIEREGDFVRDIIDEPWQDIMPSGKLEKYVPETPLTEKMLTSLDITSTGLTVVFNENDGYYHLGSADGPLVLVRISSASDHIASFTEMCETDRLGAYIYDENGKFARKESFNELIAKYAEICDEVTGVCPLDKDLEYMIKTVGGYKGWWNYEAGTQIFTDIIVPVQNAWLFACCYVSAS